MALGAYESRAATLVQQLVVLLTEQRTDHSVLTMSRQAGRERLAMNDMRCVSAVMLLLGVANKVCV